MSYILDALRRADAERERGAVPGIHAQQFGTLPHDDEPRGRSRAAVWVIAALALALIGALAWNVLRGTEPAVAVATAPAPAPPTPTPTPAGPTAPAAPVAATAPAGPLAGTPPGAAARPAAPAPAAAPVRPAVRKPPPAQTAAAPAPAAGPSSRTAAAGRAGSGSSPTAGGTAVSGAPPAGGGTGAAESRVLQVRELPEDIRRGLPNITVGGSTYSSDKASRMLMINGQIFREGDPVAGGVVLQQIKPRAAVFAIKGYRYELAF